MFITTPYIIQCTNCKKSIGRYYKCKEKNCKNKESKLCNKCIHNCISFGSEDNMYGMGANTQFYCYVCCNGCNKCKKLKNKEIQILNKKLNNSKKILLKFILHKQLSDQMIKIISEY